MSGQLCNDGVSIDRSIANDSNRTLYVDNGGRPPTGCRSSINDQIECVAKAVPDFFSRRGRQHTFTIRTGARHRTDSTQKITQRRPSTKTDADGASPRSHRIRPLLLASWLP